MSFLHDSLTVASLLLRTVERHPDALALACGERRLTYAELGARAPKLAVVVGEKPEPAAAAGEDPKDPPRT